MVDGRKEHSLGNVRLRITRMALMLDGRKEYSLENGRLRITRMVLMPDGRKEYSLENTRLRITRMALMLDGRKEYSLKNRRLRITRMALMLGMRKENSLENTRLRITRMVLMLGMRKEYSLENRRLRITRIVLMLDGRKAHSLENRRLRITRMERMWVTRILVWGYLGDYAPPCGGGDGGGASCCLWRGQLGTREGPAVVCGGASRLYAVLALLSLLFIIYTQWERLQQDRVDLRCCSLIILFVCCSFTLLTIYSCCYHFIALPFSSRFDSKATLTSKSAVVFTHLVITLLRCHSHSFLIARQPWLQSRQWCLLTLLSLYWVAFFILSW